MDVFDDRVEVSSPGRFPGLVDLHDPPGATRSARNPPIAGVCADAGLGQELEEGLRRTAEEMHLAGVWGVARPTALRRLAALREAGAIASCTTTGDVSARWCAA